MGDSVSFGMEEPGEAASVHIRIATAISQVKSVLITSWVCVAVIVTV